MLGCECFVCCYNVGMIFFYWFMVVVMVVILVFLLFYLGIYFFIGVDEVLECVVKLWNFMCVFMLLGFNIMFWGYVIVVVWQLFY